jgi:maleate isomerase
VTNQGERPVRVGLLIPSSNTVMEVDFYRHLPHDVTLHTGRMYMESTTPEGEGLMLDEYALPSARDVGTVKPDIVVFGCTSAGALRGNAYDQELCGRIGDATGAIVVSVIKAVREAITRRSVARIGVITPYVDALNEKIQASIEEDGVEVAAIHGLGITENVAIAAVTPDEIAGFAEAKLGRLHVDLVFASCTNLRAVDAIAMIESRLGVPAMSSNSAALEQTRLAIDSVRGSSMAGVASAEPAPGRERGA